MKDNSALFEFNWVTSWEELESKDFQLQWHNWYNADQNQTIFGSPELCMAWLKTYRNLRKLSPIFCVAKRSDVLCFYPMVIWRRNLYNAFSKMIVPVGYSDFDYHDPIVLNRSDQSEDVIDFFKALKLEINKKFKFDEVHLNGIRTNLPSEVGSLESDIAPFAELKQYENIDAFLASLSASLRGDLRRQMRRLKEVGNLKYTEYSDLASAKLIVQGLLKAHKDRWPNAYKAANFHSNLIEIGLPSKLVHLSTLSLNDEIISWHLGFESESTYYYYMPAIDKNYSNFSPGKLHLLLLTEQAIDKKLQFFDHLRGAENYKAGWTNNRIPLFEISIEKKSISNKIKSLLQKIR